MVFYCFDFLSATDCHITTVGMYAIICLLNKCNLDAYGNEMCGVTGQRRSYLAAVGLGLFAMLMIHFGPLLSGWQALAAAHSSPPAHSLPAALHHADHDHDHDSGAVEHAVHTVDYHALMGHHSVPVAAPEWLAALEMCGYCDLLTVSPALVLALLLALPVAPCLPCLAILPSYTKPVAASYSLRHPRAPPVSVFA